MCKHSPLEALGSHKAGAVKMLTRDGAVQHADDAEGVAVIVDGREVPRRPDLHHVGYPGAATRWQPHADPDVALPGRHPWPRPCCLCLEQIV